MIEVKHPGKLYVMGEYSVMQPGNSAVLIAVKQKMITRIEASPETRIETQYGTFRPQHSNEKSLRYVKQAYEVCEAYLRFKQVSFKPFKMKITSTLDADGKKYGFGSSGVVIVSVLDAMLHYHALNVDALTLFKLSVYTQYLMHEMSSGGDIAVAVYGQSLAYTRYDTACVTADIQCVEMEWNQLMIQPLKLDVDIFVGWTQSPYKTPDALNHAKRFETLYPDAYVKRCDEAQEIVMGFISNPQNLKYIDMYRDWMRSFQKWTHQAIETEQLTHLIQSAQDCGFVAKVSGAGGGDCGIALGRDLDPTPLYREWEKHGIIPVEI